MHALPKVLFRMQQNKWCGGGVSAAGHAINVADDDHWPGCIYLNAGITLSVSNRME